MLHKVDKNEVIQKFGLTTLQSEQIEKYISELIEYNKHTNLVGKSTLKNIWERHVADSLQLSFFVEKKKFKNF